MVVNYNKVHIYKLFGHISVHRAQLETEKLKLRTVHACPDE